MTKEILIEVIEKLAKVCAKLKIKMVFMGGIAVNVYARPRTTYDVDGVILAEGKRMDKLLSALKESGFSYDKKAPVKFIQGMPFVTLVYSKLKTYVDLFIARSDFQLGLIKRAKKVKFGRISINIIAPEDLIAAKLKSGRERDTEDVREIILENTRTLDFKYLRGLAKKLNVDIFLKDELKSLGIRG